jgi:NADH-quinone oxidoreductase subunit G
MIEIEINGQKLQAEPGSMIIQVADKAGMYIPRFCYHKKLSIAASCRMCLVEVEGGRKPMPACATPVAAGMKVFTQSAAAIDAQRSVMEFLLINHPLDCPICDQGGECELQDLSMGYGGDISQYTEGKRVIEDKNIGPLVKTDMTRCILCSRCVRFGTEVAGCRELGAVGRGEHSEITTYIEQHSMESELSGNIIDLCPVGALTNKPYRYSARAWELMQSSTIAPHDCVGSNLFMHTKDGVVKRAVAKDCEAINETWIADRDRYSCFGLYHEERLAHPEIKIDGVWQTVDWDTALNTATQRLRKIIDTQTAEQVGGLLSASSTVEEAYLFQRWLRGLGCQNIDHRLRQQDFADDTCQPVYPGLLPGLSIADIAKCTAAVVIGAHVRKDQPIINHRLRQASLKGAKIYFVNPVAFAWNFKPAGESINVDLVKEMAALAKCVADQTKQALPNNWNALLADVTVTDLHKQIVSALIEQGNQAVLFLGTLALHHPQASIIRRLAAWIVQQAKILGGGLTEGANSAGAWLAGAVPHRLAAGQINSATALNAFAMLQQARKAYVLLGVEPELDSADSRTALHALKQAECVIALTSFASPRMREYADVLLPIGPFTETAGTFVNVEGQWQSFNGVAKPTGESRPAWKVLRVLGNLANLTGFDYVTANDVLAEVKSACADLKNVNLGDYTQLPLNYAPAKATLTRVAATPLYSVDSLVRRAAPLQETPDAQAALMISIHPDLAAKLEVQEGEKIWASQDNARVHLPVKLDLGVPVNAVLLSAAIEQTVGLGLNFGVIELRK